MFLSHFISSLEEDTHLFLCVFVWSPIIFHPRFPCLIISFIAAWLQSFRQFQKQFPLKFHYVSKILGLKVRVCRPDGTPAHGVTHDIGYLQLKVRSLCQHPCVEKMPQGMKRHLPSTCLESRLLDDPCHVA